MNRFKSATLLMFLIIVFLFVSCKKANEIPSVSPSAPADDLAAEDYNQLLSAEKERIATYDFITLSSLSNEVEQYSKYEATFDISIDLASGDQYNTNIILINGYFTAPSGAVTVMPAFYKQNEGDRWAIRYAPLEVGTYTFHLKDELHNLTSTEMTFESLEPSPTRGFVHASGNKLVDSYNNQFTILGTNYAWGTMEEFKSALPKYKEHGMNYIRFWSQCDWSAFNLESKAGSVFEGSENVTYVGLGNYSLGNAARFDELMTLFEGNDIYMQLCLFNLWDFNDGHWAKSAYNTENGGPCYWKENDTDFWTNPIALKYQKQLIHYIYARWGYSKNLAVFEYWNECDNKVDTKKRTTRDEWHKAMDDYFKSLDIYNHPTTTSYAWKDHLSFNQTGTKQEPWQSQDFFAVANQHMYLPLDQDPVETWVNELTFLANQHPGDTPIFIGEFSENNAEFQDLTPGKERYFAEGIWSPIFFADTAGSNLLWRVNTTFLPSENMFDYMLYAATFIQPFEGHLAKMDFKYSGSTEGIRMGYYSDDQRLLMYIRDDQTIHTMDSGRIVKGVQYPLTGFQNGDYSLTFYSPLTGEVSSTENVTISDGSLQLSLPDFSRNLAVSMQPILTK